jgi:hypothetical protein
VYQAAMIQAMTARLALVLLRLRRDAAPLTLALVVVFMSLTLLVDARRAIAATFLFAVVQMIARLTAQPANRLSPWLAALAGAGIWVVGFGVVLPRI